MTIERIKRMVSLVRNMYVNVKIKLGTGSGVSAVSGVQESRIYLMAWLLDLPEVPSHLANVHRIHFTNTLMPA